MKTKILILTSALAASIMMFSCQKDESFTPQPSAEQSMDVNGTSTAALQLQTPDSGYYADILTNYPDPFYTRTKIRFVVSKTSTVSLSVKNLDNGISERLFSGTVYKGVYYKVFGDNKPTGNYEVLLTVNGRSYREKMTKKSMFEPEPVGGDDF